MLKTTGLAIAIAWTVAPSARAEDVLHERFLEIQQQYEKDHPGTKPVVAIAMPQVHLFPYATRAEPGLIVSNAMAKPIDRLLALARDGNKNDDAVTAAEAIIAGGKATPYDLALVFRTLGYVRLDQGDGAASVEYMQKSLAENALSNNDQYALMLQVARTQIAVGQPDASLATLARVVLETRQDKPEYAGMRGRIYYTMKDYTNAAPALQKSVSGSENANPNEREMLVDSYFKLRQFEHAEEVGEDMLRAQPQDKMVIMNLAAIYRQAGHADKAIALLDSAHQHGLLTTADEYRTAYVMYAELK